MTPAADDLTRTSRVVPTYDVPFQREFFGCSLQEYSVERLDEIIDELAGFPDGKWLATVPIETRRVFAMSCEALRRENPQSYRRLIVEGESWGIIDQREGLEDEDPKKKPFEIDLDDLDDLYDDDDGENPEGGPYFD